MTLDVAPRGPGSISTDTPGFDLDSGTTTTPISSACDKNIGQDECHWGFQRGTAVNLTPHATAGGSGLSNWSSPDCPGTGSCMVTVNDDETTIVGQFNPLTLNVVLSSSGAGVATVTSNPAGINCTSADFSDTGCHKDFTPNTSVQLTVTGGDFKGWNMQGKCQPYNSRTCTVVVNDSPEWAGAKFAGDDEPNLETTIDVKLQVTKVGTGSGTVTAKNISCGQQCSRTVNYGNTVTLTEQPDTNSTFAGWGGVCAQTAQTCTFPAGPITKIKVGFDKDSSPPTEPTDLTVTGATLTSVSIAWGASTDNIGVASYRVYKDGATVGDVTATQFTIPGLACSHTYSIGVDATDAVGNRSPQATVAAATKLCPLAARLAGVGVRRSGTTRSIEVQLRVNRATSALLALRRNGRKVAGARFKVHPGTNVLRLPIARSVAPGSYRLSVTVVDPDGGAAQVFSRGVLLPKHR